MVSHIALPTHTLWSTRMRSFRVTGILLMPGDRQRLQGAEGDARLVFELFCLHLEVGEALGQRLEHLLTLDPCQGRAQAMVHAVAKGHMRVRLPGDVEP